MSRKPFRRGLALVVLPVCLLLIACGPTEAPGLAERLRGSWSCDRSLRDGEYARTDAVNVEVQEASFKYAYTSTWACAIFAVGPDGGQIPDCRTAQPEDRGGYFEGLYRVVGDSLILQDATETVSYRKLKSDSFDFVVAGNVFPMVRR